MVVGLPLSLDGTHGPAAKAATNEANRLASVVGVPVEMYDERFTTVTAERGMLEAGLNAQARRKVVDKVAAAVMLQAWLDHRRGHLDAARQGGRLMADGERTNLDPLLPEAQVDPTPVRRSTGRPTRGTRAIRPGTVERLRRQTRPIKWIVYTAMVARHRRDHDRRCRRLVVPRPDQPAGGGRRRAELHRRRGRRPRVDLRASATSRA